MLWCPHEILSNTFILRSQIPHIKFNSIGRIIKFATTIPLEFPENTYEIRIKTLEVIDFHRFHEFVQRVQRWLKWFVLYMVSCFKCILFQKSIKRLLSFLSPTFWGDCACFTWVHRVLLIWTTDIIAVLIIIWQYYRTFVNVILIIMFHGHVLYKRHVDIPIRTLDTLWQHES